MSSYLTLLTETLKSGDLDKTSMYPAALTAGIAHLPSPAADALLVELAKRADLDDDVKATLRACRSGAARSVAWREHGCQASLEEWEKGAVTESNSATLEEMRRRAPWTQLSQQAIDGLLERGSTRASKTRFTKKTATTFAELTPSPRMGDLLPEALTLLPTDKVSKQLVGHVIYHLLNGSIPEVDVLNTDPVYLLAHACSVHAEPDEAQEILFQFPDLPARLQQVDQVALIRNANAALPVNRVADLQAVEKVLGPLTGEPGNSYGQFAAKAHEYTTERLMELIAGRATVRNSMFGIPALWWNWDRLTPEQRTDTTCVAILKHAPNADGNKGEHLCREVIEFLGDRAHDLLDRNKMLTPVDVSATPPEWLLQVDQPAWVRAISRVTTPKAATSILRAPQEAKDALVADLIARPEEWDVQAVRDLAIAWQQPLGVEVWQRLTPEQLVKIADQPGVRAWLVHELTRPMLTTRQGAVAAAAVLDANAPWDNVIAAVHALA